MPKSFSGLISLNTSFTVENYLNLGIRLVPSFKASCNNTDGGYDCMCNDGFYGTGWCCVDSDECAFGDVLDGQWAELSDCMATYHDNDTFLTPVPGFDLTENFTL